MSLERHLRWLDAQVSLAASGLPVAGDVDGLQLATMRELAGLLGDPQRDQPLVHLTGTNGKGSTTHLISLILREHGLTVGSYGSPHVSRINERIGHDALPISDDDFADALGVVRLAAEQMTDNPSWFELLTATAFRFFSDAAVDAAVVEVGMLGRYDATNIAEASVAVVTNIAKDHTDGRDGWRHAVAREKAGIVTPGNALVLGVIDDDLEHWFLDEGPGTVLRFGKQFHLRSNETGLGGRVITVETPRGRYSDVLVSLHGQHQGINAAVAIAAAEAFLDDTLDDEHLQAAVGNALMPGRLEVLSTDPLVVIDGGHNPHGARATASAFAEEFHIFGRRTLIVGMMRDKDAREMLDALQLSEANHVIACQPNWPRALPATELAEVARDMGADVDVVPSPADAIEHALTMSGEGDAILVAGSLYVAGAVRNHLLVDVDD